MDLIKKSSAGAEVITVDVVAAKDLLHHALYRYLDVRTEEEFKNGHVENALNIPYMFNTPKGRVKNPKFVDQVLAVSGKEDHLLVGCQSGVRSVYATTDLLEAEFKHVCNMGGGYIAWIGNGFAVKKPNPVEL
ncbi:UNVERIFIED_CONTAM: Thiosulfate sulfurtransferase 18 [Sesamum radiatum]|uniref:Thiosulfate sulfurtransferase 18 n=1 Tax=Sesamum radiatum TaxID=300843 RepID=A0AAW2P660_SESRA